MPPTKKTAVSYTEVLFTILIIILFGATACYTGTDKQDTKHPQQTVAATRETNRTKDALAAPIAGNLYVLTLSKTEYERLKAPAAVPGTPGSNAPVDKFVFQFLFKNSERNYPTLKVYVGRRGNKFIEGRTAILSATEDPGMAIPNEVIFGDQEISIQAIDNYITRLLGNNPAYALITFTPDIKPSNHIYYRLNIRVAGQPLFLTSLETNPSPPKDADAAADVQPTGTRPEKEK